MKLHELHDIKKVITPIEEVLEDEENIRIGERSALANFDMILINVGDLRKLVNVLNSLEID